MQKHFMLQVVYDPYNISETSTKEQEDKYINRMLETC